MSCQVIHLCSVGCVLPAYWKIPPLYPEWLPAFPDVRALKELWVTVSINLPRQVMCLSSVHLCLNISQLNYSCLDAHFMAPVNSCPDKTGSDLVCSHLCQAFCSKVLSDHSFWLVWGTQVLRNNSVASIVADRPRPMTTQGDALLEPGASSLF